jgi:hypothetical protein
VAVTAVQQGPDQTLHQIQVAAAVVVEIHTMVAQEDPVSSSYATLTPSMLPP